MDAYSQAVQEFDSGNFGRALTLLREIVAADAGHASAQRLLAATCLRLERLDDAEAAARKFIELRPDDAAGHQQLGAVCLAQNRVDEARVCFNKSLQHDPLNSEAKAALQRLGWRGSETPKESPVSAAPSHPLTPSPSPPSTWHHLLFKSAVVVSAVAIIAAAFLPQWLGSRGTQTEPNPPQRTITQNRPPEVVRAQQPNPQQQQQRQQQQNAPAASSINETIPQMTAEQKQMLQSALAKMQQQRQGVQAGPGPGSKEGANNQQAGANENAEGQQAGPNSGSQGRGKAGGSGSGLQACPICAGRGWFDCPGPAADSATALGAALGLVVGGGGGGRDICRNGTYRCPNHAGYACEHCGMDEPSGTCPSCKGTGRLVCSICGGKRKIDPGKLLGGLGNLQGLLGNGQ